MWKTEDVKRIIRNMRGLLFNVLINGASIFKLMLVGQCYFCKQTNYELLDLAETGH